jgi:hypothetical protein
VIAGNALAALVSVGKEVVLNEGSRTAVADVF